MSVALRVWGIDAEAVARMAGNPLVMVFSSAKVYRRRTVLIEHWASSMFESALKSPPSLKHFPYSLSAGLPDPGLSPRQ